MNNGKLLEWIKNELIALGKVFFWGTVALIFILVLETVFGSMIQALLGMSSFITKNEIFQIILAFGILFLLGVFSRKLQKSKRFSIFKKFLPAEIFKKPEVAYFTDTQKLGLGILIKVHNIIIEGDVQKLGEVVPTQGGPTSGGHLSGQLVPIDYLYSTGRTYGQSLAACMSFGMKMSPIKELVPFTKNGLLKETQ